MHVKQIFIAGSFLLGKYEEKIILNIYNCNSITSFHHHRIQVEFMNGFGIVYSSLSVCNEVCFSLQFPLCRVTFFRILRQSIREKRTFKIYNSNHTSTFAMHQWNL